MRKQNLFNDIEETEKKKKDNSNNPQQKRWIFPIGKVYLSAPKRTRKKNLEIKLIFAESDW